MTLSVVLIVISIATLIVGWAAGTDPIIYVSIVTAALALVMLVASYLRERRMRVQPSAGAVAPPPSLEPSVVPEPEPVTMPPLAAGFADEDEEEEEPVLGRTFSMVAKPASPRPRSKMAAKPKAKAKAKTAAKPKAKAKAKAVVKPKAAAKPAAKAKAAAKPKAKAKAKPKAVARPRAR